MSQTKLSNIVDCTDLSGEEINYEVKNLMFNSYKYIILKDAFGKDGVLSGLKGNIKIEVVGDVSSYFANNIDGPKIIVNGNIGTNSACNIKSGKLTIFGSCGNYFGSDLKSAEIYILENCSKNSFSNLTSSSKIVIGGQPSTGFAPNNDGGTVVILNLRGGSIFIENDWFVSMKSEFVYLRGEKNKIKMTSNKYVINETTDNDEDIYLPLISEFARLFNYSLSEIKSKQFYRIVVMDKW